MWTLVERYAEAVAQYQTIFGSLWNLNTFIFRLYAVVFVGDELYDDERNNFECDTIQPGCLNVCFNAFSPMSHYRIWGLTILFTSIPVLFFYLYVLKFNKKLPDGVKDEPMEIEFDEYDDKDLAKNDRTEQSYEVAKDMRRKKHRRKRLEKRDMEFGERQGQLRAVVKIKNNKYRLVPSPRYFRKYYVASCAGKFLMECFFMYLSYEIQFHQSGKSGFLECFTVPEKFICTHGTHKVTHNVLGADT